MPTANLDSVVEDAISDAQLPLEEPDLSTDASSDTASSIEEPVTTDTEVTPDPTPDVSVEVSSPAAKAIEPTKTDDFEKRFGIPANSATGRENRIPHSRVKQMVTKADKETEARVRAEYAPKVLEYETKVKDYETKLQTYEGRLGEVAQFEKILVDSPEQLLTMLYGMPQYRPYLKALFEEQPQATVHTPTQQVPQISEEMPQPDQKLGDGTLVYSMEGLSKLNAWNRAQAAKEAREATMAEVNQKFGPIYSQWEQHQRTQALLPKVQAQIADARKWPQFNENEQDIVKALQANSNLSLEAAYRQVVLPKIQQVGQTAQVDRAQLEKDIRAKVMEELKNTPRSTSATSRPTQPTAQRSGGGRSIESIIEEQIKTLK